MEYDGTPPVVDRYLADEAESPSYYSHKDLDDSGRVRAWPEAMVTDPRGLRSSPFFPAAGGPEGGDLIRLLEENWFWQPNEGPADVWPLGKAHKSIEKQRSMKYSALRSSLAHGNNTARSGRLSNGPKHERLSLRGDQSSANRPSVGDQESDTAESDCCEVIARNGDASGQNTDGNPAEIDSIGTWAQRVLFFPSKQDKEKEAREKALQISRAESERQEQETPRRQANREEEEAAHAAWRWRFNRRWRHEQAKQLDPEFGMDGDDEDGWEDALGYLDACGPGVHLQIGRMSSDKHSGSLVSTSSGGFGILLDESQRDHALADAEESATNNIASKAKKVQQLYLNQKKIEADVKARWGDTRVSMTWAGCHIKTVDIDMYGHFSFVLVKVADNTKAHRLLVRGHQSRSHADLMKSLTSEVEEVCAKHRLPMVKIALLGTGVMEWSREHRINVSQGAMTRGCDAIRSSDDVVRVAGALTRSSLPTPTRVTVNGEKLS